MPKINKKQEMDFEEDEEEEAEFNDNEEEVYDAPIKRTKGMKPEAKRNPTPPIEPKRRFGIVAPTQIRIIDTETNELVGEGDFAVIQALTDILERLERIEVQIGAAIGQ